MSQEIEIRGRLDRERLDKLFFLFEKTAELKDHYRRLSVDLSPGFDPTTRSWPQSSGTDIRLKKSDDEEKLTLKTGNPSDLERTEIEIKLQPGQFLSALDFLEALGHNSGMIYFWESWEYIYRGFEVKLSKYTLDYSTFEIESKEGGDVNMLAHDLNIFPYTPGEYKAAIDWENQNIHQPYSREAIDRMLKTSF